MVSQTLRQLYLSGVKRKGFPTVDQPRIVASITGGGGQFFSDTLQEPGASSFLLEANVPYAKEALLKFIGDARRVEADAPEVGFCSPEMAALMADAARDRALSLTMLLAQWSDCAGVGCTATIVSHYTRRGGYRAHAAAAAGDGSITAYTHELVKGARERAGDSAANSGE